MIRKSYNFLKEKKLKQKNFESQITVKKGKIAEKFILNFLEENLFTVYKTESPGPHSFDFKVNNTIVEVKACSVMKKYDEVGINIRQYEHYKQVQEKYNSPVFILFVDDILEEVYGNFINEFKDNEIYHENFLTDNSCVFFNINLMKRNICKIPKDIIEKLRALCSRSDEYFSYNRDDLKTREITNIKEFLL